MFTGRCLCGRVRFEVAGPLGAFAYCHCTSCRRASGTAFAANAPVRSEDVRWLSGRDDLTEYESSPGKHRSFCSTCGSPIYARHDSTPAWLSLRLGLIHEDPGHRAQAHYNVAEKAPWHEITDSLPQHHGDTDDT